MYLYEIHLHLQYVVHVLGLEQLNYAWVGTASLLTSAFSLIIFFFHSFSTWSRSQFEDTYLDVNQSILPDVRRKRVAAGN